MPRIPQAQPAGPSRIQAASISPAAAGAPAGAIAQLGAQVAGQASQLLRQQKDADDAAFVSETSNKMLRQESEIFDDIQTKGLSVDLGEQQAQFNERVNTLVENAPSEEAAREIRLQADNVFSRKFFPMYQKHQAGINVKNRVNSFNSALDDIQTEALTGRLDVPEAVARTNAALAGLEATSAGVVDTNKARTVAFNRLSTNHLTAMINDGRGQEVIDEINEGKWDQLTDTPTLTKILRTAERDVKQRTSADKKRFLDGVNDYVAFLNSGQDDEATAARFSPDQVNSRLEPEDAAKLNEQISDARQFGQTINEIKTATPQELSEIIQSQKPTSPDKFVRESKQFDITLKAIQARNKAIAQDPSQYVNSNSQVAQSSFNEFLEVFQTGDPDLIENSAKDYAAIQRTMQEDLGVNPQGVQLIPKQFEAQLAAQLNDFSQGGENVALQLDALKKAFGNEWTTVQRQLQQNKQMGGGLRVMSGMDFGPEMIRLGEALSINQKTYQEVIGEDNFKEIKENTAEELDDFLETLRGQPGAEAAFIQHKEAIESLAMKYISDGTFSDTDDAIKQAREDVLDSRFTFVDTYRVPKEFNADDVEDSVDNVIDSISEGKFDLRIPESGNVTNEEDRKEVYLSVLRPTPITSPNGDGILFIDQNGNAIIKNDGNPLIIDWKQLETPEVLLPQQITPGL